MKRLGICAAFVFAGLVGCIVFSAAPRASASDASCLITNQRTKATYGSADPAYATVESGDTLTIRGRCEFVSSLEEGGNFVLTLKGVGTGATLSGASNCDLPVIANGTLTIANLTIVACTAFGGQGVFNQGTLILDANTVITGGTRAGVENLSVLIMNANSVISGNPGGGVLNVFGGTVVMNAHSRITGNSGFGGIVTPHAGLTMNGGSAVTDNTPADITYTD